MTNSMENWFADTTQNENVSLTNNAFESFNKTITKEGKFRTRMEFVKSIAITNGYTFKEFGSEVLYPLLRINCDF